MTRPLCKDTSNQSDRVQSQDRSRILTPLSHPTFLGSFPGPLSGTDSAHVSMLTPEKGWGP